MKTHLLLLILFLLMLASGCSLLLPNTGIPVSPSPSPNSGSSAPQEDICNSLDDMIQLNSIVYEGYKNNVYLPDDSMIGDKIGEIQFLIPDNGSENLNLGDGGSTILEPGTPVFEIIGFNIHDVVAARSADRWIVYYRKDTYKMQLFPDPDLDKARSFVLMSAPGNIVGEITDPQKVRQVIEILKNAEFDDGEFSFSNENPAYYFYIVVPDEKTKYKLSPIRYIEFDQNTHKGLIEGLSVDSALYDVFKSHTFMNLQE